MPNTIELFKKNAPELLDKIYKSESTTSDFDINGALVQVGKNANEIIWLISVRSDLWRELPCMRSMKVREN